MGAGCGLSTRGHWGGHVICDKLGRVSAIPSCHTANRDVPCARAAAPCSEHYPVLAVGPVPNLIGFSSSAEV